MVSISKVIWKMAGLSPVSPHVATVRLFKNARKTHLQFSQHYVCLSPIVMNWDALMDASFLLALAFECNTQQEVGSGMLKWAFPFLRAPVYTSDLLISEYIEHFLTPTFKSPAGSFLPCASQQRGRSGC